MQIDSSVPIPTRKGNSKPWLYPWGSLKVGDSFFVKSRPDYDEDKLQKKLSSLGNNHAKKNGVKFTTKKGGGGVRVWRIL